MTSEQFWQAEVKRLEEKFAQTKNYWDKLQLAASRVMLDPTHAGGWRIAEEHAMIFTNTEGCVKS